MVLLTKNGSIPHMKTTGFKSVFKMIDLKSKTVAKSRGTIIIINLDKCEEFHKKPAEEMSKPQRLGVLLKYVDNSKRDIINNIII